MRSSLAGTIAACLTFALAVVLELHETAEGKASVAPTASTAGEATGSPRAHANAAEPLSGLDLDHLHIGASEVTARASGTRVAHLTLDAQLQRTADRLLASLDPPEAGIVLLDTTTGRVLVWSDWAQGKPARRDPCTEASAPAASIFKIVTAAALVEQAGATPETRECYNGGGESRVVASDLVENPKRDRWCATLAEAMGRSLNVVFARLALKSLKPSQLSSMAESFGFGTAPVPFDVPVAPSEFHIPDDELAFARTAAGFWNSHLSPVHAAVLAATIANGGEVVRPILVDSVTDKLNVLYRAPERQVLRRAVKAETAEALTQMMESTITNGTSYKAFHDAKGRPFLPNVAVAGKTGTLSQAKSKQFYTWFVGFAPSRSPRVAIAVEVLNGPKWRAKANVVAREILQAYFAGRGSPGTTRPASRE